MEQDKSAVFNLIKRIMKLLIKTFSNNGFIGSFRLLFSLIISKIFFPTARIIRYPFYIKKEGRLSIGVGFSANVGLILDVFGKDSQLIIGDNVMANYRLHIGSAKYVKIGSNTLFGSDCTVMDHSHGGYKGEIHSNPLTPPVQRDLVSLPIVIGNNCWFGDRVFIMPGVTIGDGVVIGAGSIVTKNIPSNSIAVGVPAKVIKKFSNKTQRWELEVNI
jgi:lipopolysaccharide O-acetyltransferase